MTRPGRLGGAVLAEPADDVLDVDDRVVDDHPDRDHEPREHHRVDRRAGGVEDERGCHQRERDRGQADDRRPPLEEERDEDEDHEQRPEQQRVGQVRDRDLDELGRPEDVVVHVDPRQAGPHLVERLVDPAGDVERVRPRELLDHHEQALVVVDHGVAEQRLVAPHHRPEVAELERRSVGVLPARHGDARKLLRREHRQHVMDAEPLVGGLDVAADPVLGGVRVLQEPEVERVRGDRHRAVDRHVVGLELGRVHLELELLPAVAPDDDVRDARNRHQPPAHRPVRDHREVGQVAVVAREPDLHRPAGRGERLERPRDAGRRRQARDRRRDALVHELAGLERIGAAVEDQRDRRQARDGGRAHRVEPGRRVERLLHRDRDEGLDLLGRHPEALGLHLDERAARTPGRRRPACC